MTFFYQVVATKGALFFVGPSINAPGHEMLNPPVARTAVSTPPGAVWCSSTVLVLVPESEDSCLQLAIHSSLVATQLLLVYHSYLDGG